MQTIAKHRWVVIVSLAFTIVFGGLLFSARPAFADQYGDAVDGCTYKFTGPEKDAIKRTNCGTYKDLTYTDGGGDGRAYQQTSTKSKCVQTIEISTTPSSDGVVTGFLAGQHEEADGSCENIDPKPDLSNTLGWVIAIQETSAEEVQQEADNSLREASAIATVTSAMQPIIKKQCKAEDGGACKRAYAYYIETCTKESLAKISSSDKKKNQKLNDLISACISKMAGGRVSKNDVSKALGDTIYDDIKNKADSDVATSHDNAKENGDMTCEASAGVFGWMFCGIIEGVASAADGIYAQFIQPLLITQPLELNSSDPIFKAWSQFRILGDMFLVVALLVIVFGQTIGGGIIDAYTAKKVLPRLLLAAIGINLSIYLVAGLVDITNAFGNGLKSLIETPFRSSGTFVLDLNGGATGLGLATLVAGIAWGVAIGGPLLSWLFVFVLVPLFLTLIAILAVIIIRRGLIIFLVLIAPVAFALYCLPNTEQYFRKWWELLFKTLLVYPIIAAVFGVANVLAVTTNMATAGAGGTTKTLSGIMSIFMLIIPLFLIPFAFRLAGGVLGKLNDIAGGIGQRAHGAIKGRDNDPDSLQNRVRRNVLAKNAERNLSARGIGAAVSPTKPWKGIARRRADMAAVRNMYQSVYGQKGMGAAMYEANKDDSNITGDVAKYRTGAESRRAAQEELATTRNQLERFKSAGRDDKGNAFDVADYNQGLQAADNKYKQRLFSSAAADRIGRDPAMRRRALMNPATIGYEIDPGEAGWKQADKIMREVSGGDEGTYRSLMNEFQYVAKSAAGRSDLAAATDGGAYDGYKAWTQNSLYQLSNEKPASIKGHGQYFAEQIKKTGDAKAQHQAAVFYEELEAMRTNSKGATRDAINEQQAALAEDVQRYYASNPDAKARADHDARTYKRSPGEDIPEDERQ